MCVSVCALSTTQKAKWEKANRDPKKIEIIEGEIGKDGIGKSRCGKRRIMMSALKFINEANLQVLLLPNVY